jgi:hypothetical protein
MKVFFINNCGTRYTLSVAFTTDSNKQETKIFSYTIGVPGPEIAWNIIETQRALGQKKFCKMLSSFSGRCFEEWNADAGLASALPPLSLPQQVLVYFFLFVIIYYYYY